MPDTIISSENQNCKRYLQPQPNCVNNLTAAAIPSAFCKFSCI
ncbi:MAG: hypothetical protein WAO83_11605 [Fuerstiella sp.]